MSKLFKKKKILITGSSGFLGKYVLKNLDKNKYIITLVNRKKISGYKNIIVKDFFKLKIIEYVKLLKNQDIVLHLAWYTEPEKYFNSYINFECLLGSINFAIASKIVKVKKFIGIGTCLEYLPKKKKLKTSDKILENSIYSASKIMLYKFCISLFKNASTKFSWCRMFYLYGDGEPKIKLYSYVKSKIRKKKIAKLSSGDQIKDFIHISDASLKLIQVIENNKYTGPLNICSGKGQSVKSFITKIAKENNGLKYLKFKKKRLNEIDPKYIVGKNSISLKMK